MPQLNIYPIGQDMPPHFYYQAQAFIRIFWADGDDFDIDYSLNEPAVRLVLAEGKSLISYATLVYRDIDHAGITYRCCGLGDVMTFPAFRKRGYGGQVVEAATDLMRRDKTVDFGLLWTAPHNTHFYARYGWQPMPDVITLQGSPDAPELVDDEPAMLLLVSDRALANAASFEHARLYIGGEKW